MRFSILLVSLLFLPGCPMGIAAQNIDQSDRLIKKLESHFANNYKVSTDVVHLRIMHAPNQYPKNDYSFYSQHGEKLGHQTLWISEDKTGKKYPVTLSVEVDMLVLVSNQKVRRRNELGPNNTELRIKRISRHADQYLRSFEQVEGMMAVQVLDVGEGITFSKIRPKPDMNLGDDVTVKIISGDFVIEAKGRAKKDGIIGDDIFVILAKTGKKISGEIISKNIVKVELN